jgi:hypothetical protein
MTRIGSLSVLTAADLDLEAVKVAAKKYDWIISEEYRMQVEEQFEREVFPELCKEYGISEEDKPYWLDWFDCKLLPIEFPLDMTEAEKANMAGLYTHREMLKQRIRAAPSIYYVKSRLIELSEGDYFLEDGQPIPNYVYKKIRFKPYWYHTVEEKADERDNKETQ